jgi:hypothetical protein
MDYQSCLPRISGLIQNKRVSVDPTIGIGAPFHGMPMSERKILAPVAHVKPTRPPARNASTKLCLYPGAA